MKASRATCESKRTRSSLAENEKEILEQVFAKDKFETSVTVKSKKKKGVYKGWDYTKLELKCFKCAP